MNNITFEIITLEWIIKPYSEFPHESGIYQIYGTSPLYGMNTLLYIGQANDLNDRIRSHIDTKKGVISRQPSLSCRYAKVDKDLLNVVEQILIVMHKPSFNSAGLKRVGSELKAKPYYIQNHGERGMLNIENTNFYFINDLQSLLESE